MYLKQIIGLVLPSKCVVRKLFFIISLLPIVGRDSTARNKCYVGNSVSRNLDNSQVCVEIESRKRELAGFQESIT